MARLLATNSDVTKAFNVKIKDFENLALFFYEYGLMLNDDANFKMALLSANNASAEFVKSLMTDIGKIISPDAKEEKSVGENMPALMKELENTIVTFDRKSVQQALAASDNEKLRI